MNNINSLKVKHPAGFIIEIPFKFVMESIDNLSDDDKAELATTIVNMLPNTKEGKYLALNVLRYRCNFCGTFLNVEHGVCYCERDE